jgi:ubiquinone/menaquinone biosynthesis C-methylase UbiE
MRSLLAFAACVLVAAGAAAQTRGVAGAPYIATPQPIVERMLALAKVGPKDHVIDLGSGDGRLVITAVSKFNARTATGVEIDPRLVALANANAVTAGVADRARFIDRDLFEVDTADATVVTLYLVVTMMRDVADKLRKELKPGTRVVSHDYPLPGWRPVSVVVLDTPEKRSLSGDTRTELFLYRVPRPR